MPLPVIPLLAAAAAVGFLALRNKAAAGTTPGTPVTPGTPGTPGQPGVTPPHPGTPPPPPVPAPIYKIADASTLSGVNTGRPKPSAMVVTGVMGPGNAPITIAQYGSGNAGNYQQLGPLNPHLTIGSGGSREMGGAVGQAIDVPWSWAAGLKAAGFDVRQDLGAGPNSVATAGLEIVGHVPFEGLPEIVGAAPRYVGRGGHPPVDPRAHKAPGPGAAPGAPGPRYVGRSDYWHGLTPLPMGMTSPYAHQLSGALDAGTARTVAWSLRNNPDPAHLEGLASVVPSPAKERLLQRAAQLRGGR